MKPEIFIEYVSIIEEAIQKELGDNFQLSTDFSNKSISTYFEIFAEDEEGNISESRCARISNHSDFHKRVAETKTFNFDLDNYECEIIDGDVYYSPEKIENMKDDLEAIKNSIIKWLSSEKDEMIEELNDCEWQI